MRNVRNENKITDDFSRMSDDIRAPVLWRRPNAKTYSYNQVGGQARGGKWMKSFRCLWSNYCFLKEFGGSYYQPMINYIDTKNRQGVFFEPPTERIHLPDSAETYMARSVDQPIRSLYSNYWPIRGEPRPEVVTGVGNVESFLVKSRSQRMKEVNGASGKWYVSLKSVFSSSSSVRKHHDTAVHWDKDFSHSKKFE